MNVNSGVFSTGEVLLLAEGYGGADQIEDWHGREQIPILPA